MTDLAIEVEGGIPVTPDTGSRVFAVAVNLAFPVAKPFRIKPPTPCRSTLLTVLPLGVVGGFAPSSVG